MLILLPGYSVLAQKKSTAKANGQNKNKLFYSTSKLPAGLEVPPKTYQAFYTEDSLKIDGNLDEPAWQKASWTDQFEDILGNSVIKGINVDRAENILPTKVKMCWDHQYLYIAAKLNEPHISGSIVKRDAIIYHDNDFEVFVNDGHNQNGYFEFEINTLNTVLDLFMTKPYRDGGNALINWDAKGLKHAVVIQGTLNQPSDVDSAWVVEMAIPFTALRFWNAKAHPEPGDYWRINFSRVQWDNTVDHGKYRHKIGAKGQLLPEHNWVWSPQGVKDMHYPERWGYLIFADSSKYYAQNQLVLPVVESLKNAVWKIYYLQRMYFTKHNIYALTLSQLGVLTDQIELTTGQEAKIYHLQMEATGHLYMVRVVQDGVENALLTLDQNGRLTTN